MASKTGKFEKLAAETGSKRLAGWITTHNPKVRARAAATRAADKGIRKVARKSGGKKGKRG